MKNLHETAYRAKLTSKMRFQLPLLLLISAAVMIFGVGRAQAIIWNGTDHPERGVTSATGLTDQPGYFSNVKSMYNNYNSTRGTATYLANGWVITARHMIQGANYGVLGPSNQMSFYSGGNNYGSLSIVMPYSAEIALVRLQTTPSGMTELPSSVIYTGYSETGMLAQMGGYGYYGPVGGTVSTDASFHRGYNIAFINGSSVSTALDGEQRLQNLGLLEVGTMPGDSGSPLFLLNGPDTSVADWSQYQLGGILATSQGNYWGADSNYVRMGGFSQLIKDIVWGSGKSYQWARGIAGTFSWNNSTLNGDVTNGNNWSSSLTPTFPVGAGDMVKLGSGMGANNQTINLDQNVTVGQLAIGCTNGGSGIQTLAAGGAFTLTFDGLSGPGMIIHNSGSRNDVISAPIVVAGNGTLYTSNPSSYSITISGSIVSGLSSGTQLLQHTLGDLIVSGNISNGSTGGAMGIEVDGGRLILSGNNSGTGSVVMADGATLQLVANSGNISTVGGVPTSSVLGNNPASGSTGFQLGYNDNGSVRIELRSDSSVAFANTTTGNNSGNVTLNFDVNNVAAISGSGPQNQTLTFAPAGEISRNSGYGLTTYNTTINATGGNGYTLAIDKITSYGSGLNINANSAKVQIGSIGETGSTTLGFAGAYDTAVTGPISNSGGTLTLNKSGAGTLTFQGNNTYSGTTTISAGKLVLSGNNTTSGNMIIADSSTLQLVANSGNISTVGGVPTSSALGNNTASGTTGFQLGNNDNGSVGIQLRGDSSVAFANTTTGNNTSNVTLNFDVNNVAAISGSGPQNQILTFAPAGETSRNSGNGLTTGNTSINAAGGNGYTLAIDRITSNGGLLSINANTAKVQINSIAETGSTTLSFGGAANTTVTGPISNSSGTLTLNKGGTGTLMLQGNNTYTGATNVNQGQLIIDGGDLADVSTVNVAGSASLQVISGAPILGNVAGSGSTSISGAGTVLTVSSLSQSNLTIGAGTTLVIAPIPGGPLSAYDLKTVPEPQTFIMLLIALAMAAMVRKSRR